MLEAIGGFGQGIPVIPVSGESKLSGFEVRAPETRQDELAWGEVLFRKDGDSAVVIVGRAHKDRFVAFKRIFEETGRSLTISGETKK
ncbi:MAG: hypothetical protein HYU64_12835 [Armatimonadetes bacterium]|nr:hypothetical protein [Armatimonadota bacterium]